MMAKRSLETRMPNPKRCKAKDSAREEENENPISKKRPKGYPSQPLDPVASAIVTVESLPRGFGGSDGEDLSSATSNCSDVVEPEPVRPPVVKTSRGRVQVIPSRFRDSIVDLRKKGDSRLEALERVSAAENAQFRCKKQKSGHRKEEFSSRKPDLIALQEQEEEEQQERFFGFDAKKNSSSRSSVTTVEERNSDCAEVEKNSSLKGRDVKRDDFFRPEEFVLGDIVWAKTGKYPAWPGIVIDPISQAPKAVLSFCIAGAICVMFFGHSRNGKRVNMKL